MNTIIVTLRYLDNETDLELPANVPIFMLAPILMEKLNWPGLEINAEESDFSVRSKAGILRPTETLHQGAVGHGEILELIITEPRKTEPDRPPVTSGKTFLQCTATGVVFMLRGRSTLIGRSPEMPVALNMLPNSDMVSRKHANLVRRGNEFRLKDEHSTNGTIVDGYMLRRGENVHIRHGSQIQFGEDGPTLIFHCGTAVS